MRFNAQTQLDRNPCDVSNQTLTGKHDTIGTSLLAQQFWDVCVHTPCLRQRNPERNMCIQSSLINSNLRFIGFDMIRQSWITDRHQMPSTNQSSLQRDAAFCLELLRKFGIREVRTENFNISTDIVRATCLWACEECWKPTWLGILRKF